MAAKDSHKNAAATIKVCTTGPSENPGTQNQRVARQKPPKIPDFHRQFAKSGYRCPDHEPETFGIHEPIAKSYWGQLLHPFRRAAGTRCVGPERIIGTQGALR